MKIDLQKGVKKTEKHLLENTIQFSQRIIKKRTSAFQIWS